MKQIFLLLNCALVALTTGDVTTTAQTPAAPECPNLTKEQRKKLEESRVHNFDPHALLIGEFHEVLEPQTKNTADGSWNCVSKKITKIDDNRLRESITITNSKTGNAKMVNYILDKIKTGIYLVRKATDLSPVARTYIMSAKIGLIANFICSVEPAGNGFGTAFGDLMTLMGITKRKNDATPDEKPLPKMSNVFATTYFKTSSLDLMNTIVKELKETMSKDAALFGPIQDSKTCEVKTS